MKNPILFFAIVALISCNSKKSLQSYSQIDTTYISRGNAIAKLSFETLSGELQKALQQGGIDSALHYCNLRAYPLTDSLSTAFKASIKRVSNKVRNPNNKADELATFILKGFSIDLSENKAITPKLVLKDDSVLFFKPIITQPLCLACHGTPGKEIAFSTDATIQQLYPTDKAVGYSTNQVRGVWRIGFRVKN
ncbi:MAG: DUF3365 domain-containing protein [Cyclobacteriaceae bacterium]|nr:DUF3365 domain-containing protein [Cyclobacteriaceae bacterium]